MATPITLTLKGDGRVVALTPATVRPAFFRFVTVNGLRTANLRAFEVSGLRSSHREDGVLDRLFRRSHEPAYLTPFEIASVERQMNRMLIRQDLRMVDDEGVIRYGTVAGRGTGLRWRRVPYLIRHGIIFELESLRRAVLLGGGQRDVVLEWPEHEFGIARFLGVVSDRRRGRLLVRFAHRLDLKRSWTVPQAEFDCRRLFAVRRVAACDGFRLSGPISLAGG